jgi:hypothetical protein
VIQFQVSPHVLWSLGGLYAILVVASAWVMMLRCRAPEKDRTELVQRIRSWWLIVSIFTLVIIMSRNVSVTFFAFVSFLALKEYLSIVPTRRADRRVLFWAYLSIPVQYYWVAQAWYGMFIIFIPEYVFVLLPMRMVLIGETKEFLRAAGTLHWGIMTMVFGISHIAYFLVLPEGSRGEPEQMQSFKGGIARLAESNPTVPVIPVFLHGLGKALPKGETILVPFFCDVFVGEPLPWTGDRRSYMRQHDERMRQLAAEGNFPSWE